MQAYDVVVKGDPDAAFASADRVFERTYRTPRYHAGYIEPRATLVWFDGNGALHVLSTNKARSRLRDMIARTTGFRQEKIVVEPSFIGGEFGAKVLADRGAPALLSCACDRPRR